jgi:hypothetical protein
MQFSKFSKKISLKLSNDKNRDVYLDFTWSQKKKKKWWLFIKWFLYVPLKASDFDYFSHTLIQSYIKLLTNCGGNIGFLEREWLLFNAKWAIFQLYLGELDHIEFCRLVWAPVGYKDYKIGICFFFAKCTALSSKIKHWLAQNRKICQ